MMLAARFGVLVAVLALPLGAALASYGLTAPQSEPMVPAEVRIGGLADERDTSTEPVAPAAQPEVSDWPEVATRAEVVVPPQAADPPEARAGFAIVKAIAEGHGGTVKLVSTPGEGATLGLVFPAGIGRP